MASAEHTRIGSEEAPGSAVTEGGGNDAGGRWKLAASEARERGKRGTVGSGAAAARDRCSKAGCGRWIQLERGSVWQKATAQSPSCGGYGCSGTYASYRCGSDGPDDEEVDSETIKGGSCSGDPAVCRLGSDDGSTGERGRDDGGGVGTGT